MPKLTDEVSFEDMTKPSCLLDLPRTLARQAQKPNRIRTFIGTVGILVLLAFAFIGGRIQMATSLAARVNTEDQINYQMVMLALDSGWKATWIGGLQPLPDTADGDQQACWRVPLYDIARDPEPLKAWRCIDRANEQSYTWVVEKAK